MKKKTRIALLVADFNKDISCEMVTQAKEATCAFNARIALEVHVPGSYEIPLAAKKALQNPHIDAVVALGWIEKGETLHGQVMGNVVHSALMALQLEYEKPIGFGIIGPGATKEQAALRTKSVARHAIKAVCKGLDIDNKAI